MGSKFVISNSSEDEKDYIGNRIDAFNNKESAFTQSPIFESINFIVKNDKDEIMYFVQFHLSGDLSLNGLLLRSCSGLN